MPAQELSSALKNFSQDPRVTLRRAGVPNPDGRCVVYWMQRAQRGRDNAALNLAVQIADELGLPVVTYFAGISNFPHANLRHYHFLQQGLLDVENDLAERGIGFVLRNAPECSPVQFFADAHAAIVIGDENPLRAMERWRSMVAKNIEVPYWTIDTDVIVPSKLLEKAQYAARTIRPRLKKFLPEFLHLVKSIDNSAPAKEWQQPRGLRHDKLSIDMTKQWPDLDRSVLPVDEWNGGSGAAYKRLHLFTKNLGNYDRERNHPETDGTSMLSPFLHFGHIGPLTIALAVRKAIQTNPAAKVSGEAYLDQLITWRELCINFVKYEPNYDTAACADPWAKVTIGEHARDERSPLYSLEQLERAETYDELWNASQRQMVYRGWMHNYMRMYWAKKILEWSPSVDVAFERAVHLNDRYFLDGRDPNGYGSIAWALVGKFDRAWGERPIFGKIRYMSGASTGRKFDSKKYIAQNPPAGKPAEPLLF
ncbi:deoxyribodipyrimidine photo-lyase [Terriglobus saanensis]|uniref:Deoxyribodipyrimidine photo-lyase n=1 Tax=Terriglobus saanensis (strain ATCC BAA-1853 / DSM 23119 / SP1PR4) TaxID=401053 RepID=E8V3R5_TERSS|nr:deoxyribodipyrimidine photo-lyase [Terriglobus saanensis]ADV84752.1 DNA photolyase FAD-binding protein [Terriglobus saanensis SP1PR4]